jgi:hypothetical protein
MLTAVTALGYMNAKVSARTDAEWINKMQVTHHRTIRFSVKLEYSISDIENIDTDLKCVYSIISLAFWQSGEMKVVARASLALINFLALFLSPLY